MRLMYHSHSAASFLLLAKHVQGVRPDGSTFKRTHKKWQNASFIHIVQYEIFPQTQPRYYKDMGNKMCDI